MRIFRYELEVRDRQILELPMSAQPLHVAPGRDPEQYSIDLWCLVPELAPALKYQVDIYGTGQPIDWYGDLTVTAAGYVGTAVMPDGYVWHVFVRPVRP